MGLIDLNGINLNLIDLSFIDLSFIDLKVCPGGFDIKGFQEQWHLC